MIVRLFFFLLVFVGSANASARFDFDVRKYHALGDGNVLDTEAIQNAIDACGAAGGGRVIFPAGIYLSGTLHLRNKVELHLQKNARLLGTPELTKYKKFSGTVGEPAMPRDRWHQGLIMGEGVADIALTGEGIVDGNDVFDPNGEEHRRGPHLILLAHCKNVKLRDLTLQHAANYAFLYFHTDGVVVERVTFLGGSDGVHFRGTDEHWNRGLKITRCHFFTGDDCIAGHYQRDCVIKDCTINSSCNGIRVIDPVQDFTVTDCDFFGPGKYEHRVSKRTNMLAAVNLEPSSWTKTPGHTDRVRLENLTMKDVTTPFHISMRAGTTAGKIKIDHIRATGIYRAPISIESWGEPTFEEVSLRDMQVEFTGGGTLADAAIEVRQPGVDARKLPAWGLYLKTVNNITLDHVTLTTQLPDARPAILKNNVIVMREHKTRFEAAR